VVPTEEQLIKFIKSKEYVNFSLIAKHFNIKNPTVSDLIKDLEEKNLVEVNSFGGSKFVKVKEDKFKMKKRGQVTVYIILGILIVVLLGVVLYLNYYGLKSQFEREQARVSVLNEFIPVKNYFDSCIRSIALNGANTLGLQGGYINIPIDEMPVNPTLPFSNRLQVFGNNALEVPYWFYETANGIQQVQVPSKKDMENSLGDYISNNINDCLLNFTEFKDYEVSGFDDVKTEVTIDNEKIFIRVLSKLTAKYKGLTQEFENFLVILDVPLGSLYNKSREILEKENTEYFFEQKTIDMLVLYDEIPYHGINLNCNPRIWAIENVKQDLKKIIQANVEAINPNAPRTYFKYNLNTEGINTNFRYNENWPLFLEVDGGEQILKENSLYGENNPAAGFLRTLFCMNNYNFVYDIKYPILVTLNKNNFDFQFATMVIIDNNQPRENRLGVEAPRDTNPVICESASVETNVNVVDLYTNSQISNAIVKFSCVGTICKLGETTSNGLNVKVPACLNAEISIEKEGYQPAKIIVDTTEKSNLFIYLKPKYKKQVGIQVVSDGIARNLLSSEFIIFTLKNLDDETQTFITSDIQEIELSEGEYEVNSYILKNYPNGITLQKREIQYCTSVPKPSVLGLLGITDNKCVKTELPETKLEQVLVGGARYKFTLTKAQLENSNKIIFYTNYNKVPNNIQELSELYNIVQNQNSLPPRLT